MQLNRQKIRSLLVRSGFYRPVMYMRRRFLRSGELAHRNQSVKFFNKYIKPGDLVFDVGGNIGNTAEVFLLCGARVISFEPLPHCAAELRARFGQHPQFTCVPEAVGAAPGSATLYIHRNDFMSSFNREWSSEWQGSVEVPVVTLSELIARFGVPAFLKIDVEGWEQQVLAGLSIPVPMLSFEFHSGNAGYEAVLACLARLCTLGSIRVNRTPQEMWSLALDQWLDPEAFLLDLKAHMAAHPDSYGDVLVQMNLGSSDI